MASARSLTTDRIWRALEKTAFAVISFVTPEGEPRSSGVVCAAARRHLYVVTASGSWKARQISDGDPVSVTVPGPPRWLALADRADTTRDRYVPGPRNGSSSWFSVHRVRVEQARFASTAGAQERLSARVGGGGRFPHLRRGRVPARHGDAGCGDRTRAGRMSGRCPVGLSAGRSNRGSGRRREEATLGVDDPGQVPVAVAVPYWQHLGAAGVRPADGVADLRPLEVPLGVGRRHVGATVGQVGLPELPIPVGVM